MREGVFEGRPSGSAPDGLPKRSIRHSAGSGSLSFHARLPAVLADWTIDELTTVHPEREIPSPHGNLQEYAVGPQ
jgi:hypothetical protein